MLYGFVNDDLRADRGVVEHAVSHHGMALQYAPAVFKNDRVLLKSC